MKRFVSVLLFSLLLQGLQAQEGIPLLDKVAGHRVHFHYTYSLSRAGADFAPVTDGQVTVEGNAYILEGLGMKVVSDGTTRWTLDPEAKEAVVAYDAITLITNNASRDTLISKDEIQQIVNGKITDWSQLRHSNGQKGEIEIVFDNNGSSTVRYMRDSLCAGRQLKGRLRAATTNEELISYVKKKQNAIGVLGVDWVGNKQDTTRLSFLSDVRIMSVGARNSEDADDYYKPFQFYIASGSYPLTRGLYITSTDPRTRSMQRNFFFYLTDNPNHNNMGQMMILRFSQLLPYMAVQSHNVVIKRY